jgi:hypothetical protein
LGASPPAGFFLSPAAACAIISEKLSTGAFGGGRGFLTG